MYIPRPVKLLFTFDYGWNRFLDKFGDSVSEWTKLSVERMLACGTCAMGVRRYCCASLDCDWQHITFTMPHVLWPFFNNNWPRLNDLFRSANRSMLRFARKMGIEIGIFCALHTYGRQLGQHPHIHLSITRGGLCLKHCHWRALFFKKKNVEHIWRIAVTGLLRRIYDRINPGSLPGFGHIRDNKKWRRYLEAQYQRHWKVHFAKKTRGAWRNVKYIGRYLKRPRVAASQLRHYSGGAVIHQYYDHRTQLYRRQKLTQEDMIGRYISHVPSRHFKMVRYYGILSNLKRGALLPKVYEALDTVEKKKPEKAGFAALMKGFLGIEPYKCILCGDKLRFAGTKWNTSDRITGRKASRDGKKTKAADRICGSVRLKNRLQVKYGTTRSFFYEIHFKTLKYQPTVYCRSWLKDH